MKPGCRLLAIAMPLILAAGCMSAGSPMGVTYKNRTQFESEWPRYLLFAPNKALAVGGDVRGKYVLGYAHAYPSEGIAAEAALEECEARRTERRIAAPCRLYARGDSPVELEGGNERDDLVGGPGPDRVVGHGGADVLEGGAGADDFVFGAAFLGDGVDEIVDFEPEEGDELVFEGFEAELDLSRVRLEGGTLLLNPKSSKAWVPVVDLGRSDLSLELLARRNSLDRNFKLRFVEHAE